MSKEKYLEELSDELKISKPMLKRFIHTVGTNKENIKDYAKNISCAIVRKDNGFDISYVAQMLNEKDAKIKYLEHRLANCIEPKFKIGQEVWVADDMFEKIRVGKVEYIETQKYPDENVIWYHIEYFDECFIGAPFEEEITFATEEEAKAKLEELNK